MRLLERIRLHGRGRPDAIALGGDAREIPYRDLAEEIERTAGSLRKLGVSTLGLDLDNGPTWALVDLAALVAGVCLVPIPPFFSPQQVRHCLKQADVQAVISDRPGRLAERAGDALAGPGGEIRVMHERATVCGAVGRGRRVPGGIAKVTYTSGTTGEPKGVMLGWDRIEPVVSSLALIAGVEERDRHLALSPLSVLLENIAGLYVPLWGGATAILPPLAETGLTGAAGIDAMKMTGILGSRRATTAILSPQTLQGLVEAIEAGAPAPGGLRFAAVGGAPLPRRLLERARGLGLPVYQGYGLSECASVATLNTPLQERPGSVGRPLPHLRLRVTGSGEILVADNLFSGYLGGASVDTEAGWWHTGDLGYLDGDGFLYLTGRKRNVFITAFGRNVSPEWVESELVLEDALLQAAVFGEARPWNLAIVVPTPGADPQSVTGALARANARLPDYARVSRWACADEPFTPGNGLLSGTGRVRRQAVYRVYRQRIESLYQEELVS